MFKLFEKCFLQRNKQLVFVASQKLLSRPYNNFFEVKPNLVSSRYLHNEFDFEKIQTDDVVDSDCVKSLRKLFKCSEKEAIDTHRILTSDPVNMNEFRKILLWIHRKGASMSVIIRNCHILLVPLGNSKQSYLESTRFQIYFY